VHNDNSKKEYELIFNTLQKVITRFATFVLFLGGLFLTMNLGGCASNSTTPIQARDNTIALGELRIAFNFDHNKQAALPHTGEAIEIGITKTRGSADQSLTSGQLPIILGDTRFTAPQQLKNDFDFTYNDMSWRNRFFNEDQFGTEISVGGGYSSIDLKVSSATQVASKRIESIGLRAGAGVIYLLSPSSSIQARGSIFGAPLQYTAAKEIIRLELVYAKAFLNNFRLRAGYTSWHVSGVDDRGSSYPSSDFKLEFSGPVLALDLEF
jgi:hypothetical protein